MSIIGDDLMQTTLMQFYVAGCEVDTAAASSAAVGSGAVETGSFRTASGGSGTGGGGSGVCVNPVCVTVTSEPPSTHESCLPHDCNRHLLFGCLSAAASALSNAFVLVQVSRFQQIIGVFTLQAPTEVAKVSLSERSAVLSDTHTILGFCNW